MSEKRSIVSDTGPLISLERIEDGYAFVRRLYDNIILPHAVLEGDVLDLILSASVILCVAN